MERCCIYHTEDGGCRWRRTVDSRVGRGFMDTRRLVALSGIMVKSMADGFSKIYAMIRIEYGTVEDGDGGS